MSNYIINSRAYTVTIDQYGIDALKNKAMPYINNIDSYSLYNVKQYQRGRPDNIANAVYGDSNLWWVIMYYNGISDFKKIVESVTLRIPDITSVTYILAEQAAQSYGNNIRIVTI